MGGGGVEPSLIPLPTGHSSIPDEVEFDPVRRRSRLGVFRSARKTPADDCDSLSSAASKPASGRQRVDAGFRSAGVRLPAPLFPSPDNTHPRSLPFVYIRSAITSLYPGLKRFSQTKIPTFPDEIAVNILNKCTFINPNSPWTSRTKTEIQYESSTGKLYDDHLRRCPYSCDCISTTPQFGYQHFVELSQSNLHGYTNSLTFPGLQKLQKNGNFLAE